MRTERQTQASRANGAKSRGPVTTQGKSNSSRNAFQHGLRAQFIFPGHESDPNWTALFTAYLHELEPHSELEHTQVKSMALSVWRWKHFAKLEPVILDQRCNRKLIASTRVAPPNIFGVNPLRDIFNNIDERTQQPFEKAGMYSKTNPPSGPEPARPAILKKLTK